MIKLKYILLITLLLVVVISQGGGGPRRRSSSVSTRSTISSRSSTKTRRRRKRSQKQSIYICQNRCYKDISLNQTQKKECLESCTIQKLSRQQLLAKCENQCYKNEQFDDQEIKDCFKICQKQFGTSYSLFFLFLGIFGGIGGIVGIFYLVLICTEIKYNNPPQLKTDGSDGFSKEYMQNIKQFEEKQFEENESKSNLSEANESEANKYEANEFEAEIKEIAKWFAQNKLLIIFYQDKKTYTTQPFSMGINQKTNFLYDIKFTTTDQFGTANYEGELSFQSKRQKLWMRKNYQDKLRAGQTGSWNCLIYEGEFLKHKGVDNGKWYYKGFENNIKYSGSWKMKNVTKKKVKKS